MMKPGIKSRSDSEVKASNVEATLMTTKMTSHTYRAPDTSELFHLPNIPERFLDGKTDT